MSIQLPCCFRVFYDYPSWQTVGGPYVLQVPGYLKTHVTLRYGNIGKYELFQKIWHLQFILFWEGWV